MSTEELAQRIVDHCHAHAFAALEMGAAVNAVGEITEPMQQLINLGVEAGVGGTLQALLDLGLLGGKAAS